MQDLEANARSKSNSEREGVKKLVQNFDSRRTVSHEVHSKLAKRQRKFINLNSLEIVERRADLKTFSQPISSNISYYAVIDLLDKHWGPIEYN